MANNTTTLEISWPENFWDNLITAFTASMAIGLVIGGLVWALLVCLARRRASAPISQWSAGSGRRSRASHHGLRTGLYRQSGAERRSNLSLASLTFQRQASLELAGSFPRKSSFRGSTFHPFLQCPPLHVETDSQLVTLPAPRASAPAPAAQRQAWPDLPWAGLAPPPPAYDSIIKAFPDS